MFAHRLATHIQFLAELAEREAILSTQLIKKVPPAIVRKGFKNIAHCYHYATIWLHVKLKIVLIPTLTFE